MSRPNVYASAPCPRADRAASPSACTRTRPKSCPNRDSKISRVRTSSSRPEERAGSATSPCGEACFLSDGAYALMVCRGAYRGGEGGARRRRGRACARYRLAVPPGSAGQVLYSCRDGAIDDAEARAHRVWSAQVGAYRGIENAYPAGYRIAEHEHSLAIPGSARRTHRGGAKWKRRVRERHRRVLPGRCSSCRPLRCARRWSLSRHASGVAARARTRCRHSPRAGPAHHCPEPSSHEARDTSHRGAWAGTTRRRSGETPPRDTPDARPRRPPVA